MDNLNQGPYRKDANPHKEAYEQQERVRRILENAPEKFREMQRRINWLGEDLDFAWKTYHDLVEEHDAAVKGRDNLQKAFVRAQRLGAFFFAALVLSAAMFFYVHSAQSARMQDLARTSVTLMDENSELRGENASLARQNAELECELGLTLRDLRGEESRRHQLAGRLEAVSANVERLEGRLFHETVRADGLAVNYDYEYWVRQYEDQQRGLVPASNDPLVMDDWGQICRDSELLGPEGTCPY